MSELLHHRSEWDTLKVVLWVSRIFGVAPVSFDKDRPGCNFTVSKPFLIYSKLLIVFLHTCIILGGIYDILVPAHAAVRIRNNWTGFAWFSETAFLIITTSIAVFNSRERLQCTILYLDVVDKIKYETEIAEKPKTTRVFFCGTIIFIVTVMIFYAANVYAAFVSFFSDDRNFYNTNYSVYLLASYYIELMILLLLELQFMCIGMIICSGLRCVNKGLKYTAKDLQLAELQPKTTSKSIRQITLHYTRVCDVIAGVNDKYGLLLLLYTISFILHFTLTLLYFIYNYYSEAPSTATYIIESIFLVVHFLCMLIVVEPGYKTEMQNKRTQALMRHLMQRVSPENPMFGELDMLLKHIELNKVCYSPLGFCKLTRSLISVIVGAASLYIIIVLEFYQMKV